MNHDEFKHLVHEYFRGVLTEEQRAEVEGHAEECSSCSEFMKSCQELTCREFVDFLHAYIDKELPAERSATFDRHLAVCPDCTNYLESYRKTMGLSVAAMSELAKCRVPEDLVRAILEARERN